jgi:type IV pilus assembly protein PilO
MGARHADRLWIGAGAVIVIVLVAISWFFVISTKYADTDDVRAETETTETQIVVLKKRIAELKKQKAKLPEYKAALKVNQNALPPDSGVPDLLRQLESSGDALNVSVGGINVSGAVLAPGFANVYALPITLTAEGSADNLGKFLTQMQNTQPRAVLINSATMAAQAADGAADSASADVAISLSMQAFVSVPAGAGAPSITTTK